VTNSGEIINQIYGDKVRVRVCGLCRRDNELLLVKHLGLGEDGELWAPPGGGLDFGCSAEENLVREFMEETGLEVEVHNFLFVNEFLSNSLHAIELFFDVELKGGAFKTGSDPEMKDHGQIIKSVKFLSWEEIIKFKKSQVHNVIVQCSSLEEIFNLKGYFKFKNNYIK
jgi:8-oxo-dGTP diphosphatase